MSTFCTLCLAPRPVLCRWVCTHRWLLAQFSYHRLFHLVKFCTTDSCITSNFVLHFLSSLQIVYRPVLCRWVCTHRWLLRQVLYHRLFPLLQTLASHYKLCTRGSCITSNFVQQILASHHILYCRLLHPVIFCTTDSCIPSNSVLQTPSSHHLLYYRLLHNIRQILYHKLLHPIKFCTADSSIT